MSFLRVIIFMVLGYYIFKIVKQFLLGSQTKAHVKQNDKRKEENIQEKYADKIEDADFEELE